MTPRVKTAPLGQVRTKSGENGKVPKLETYTPSDTPESFVAKHLLVGMDWCEEIRNTLDDNCCQFWAMFLASNQRERIALSCNNLKQPTKKFLELQRSRGVTGKKNGFTSKDMIFYLEYLVKLKVIKKFSYDHFKKDNWKYPQCMGLQNNSYKSDKTRVLVLFGRCLTSNDKTKLKSNCNSNVSCRRTDDKWRAAVKKLRFLKRERVPNLKKIKKLEAKLAAQEKKPKSNVLRSVEHKGDINTCQSVIKMKIASVVKSSNKAGGGGHAIGVRHAPGVAQVCDNGNFGKLPLLTPESLGCAVRSVFEIRELKLFL